MTTAPYSRATCATSSSATATTGSGTTIGAAARARAICACGHAFVVVGDAGDPFFIDARNRGVLGAVPAPAFPAVPDRAFPEGGAADVVRPAGRRAQSSRHPRRGHRQALQAHDPRSFAKSSCASRTATGSTRFRSSRRRRRCTCDVELSRLDPLYDEVKERIGDMNELPRRGHACAGRRTPSCG